MIFRPFLAYVARAIDRCDSELPLCQADEARLRAQLPSGESTLMVIRDGFFAEEVKVGNQAGVLFLAGRGLGETVPRRFPRGSALCFEMTVSVVEALIERSHARHRHGHRPDWPVQEPGWPDPPEPPEPPEAWAANAFPGTVGVPWSGFVMFRGARPVRVTVRQAPAWTESREGPGFVAFSGIPEEEGEWTVEVEAANCAGKTVWTASVTVQADPTA
jgi:hypothetical protein